MNGVNIMKLLVNFFIHFSEPVRTDTRQAWSSDSLISDCQDKDLLVGAAAEYGTKKKVGSYSCLVLRSNS